LHGKKCKLGPTTHLIKSETQSLRKLEYVMMREKEESLNRLSQASGNSKLSKKIEESSNRRHDYYQDKHGFLSPNLREDKTYMSPFSD
jgi:hypothetical protein